MRAWDASRARVDRAGGRHALPPFSFRMERLRRGSVQVGKDKAVQAHDLTGTNRDGMAEHRSVIGECVKLASFAAWIGSRRQIRQQRLIELPSDERRGDLLRIDADQAGPQTRCNHLARQRSRGQPPEGKHRRQPGAGQLRFPVSTHIL